MVAVIHAHADQQLGRGVDRVQVLPEVVVAEKRLDRRPSDRCGNLVRGVNGKFAFHEGMIRDEGRCHPERSEGSGGEFERRGNPVGGRCKFVLPREKAQGVDPGLSLLTPGP